MTSPFSDSTTAKLISQLYQDPGLPAKDPTISSWQEPPHHLADVQSESLTPVTDFAIIGSGITGCSVAKHLLESPLSGEKRVTVFEARTLASGATSRNAGFLVSGIPKMFARLVEGYGKDMAIHLARYCNRTIEQILELASSEGPELKEACQIRQVDCVTAFQSPEALAETIASFQQYAKLVPEDTQARLVYGKEEAEKKFDLKNFAGAVSTASHVLSPYRLITGLFEKLLGRYSGRFSVETNTPVTSILVSHTDVHYPYVVQTPRGNVRAAKIFYCMNGHTSHLLPNLRGKIYPSRVTNSCQTPGPQFPDVSSKYSYMFFTSPNYDSTSGLMEPGMYWMQQDRLSGNLIFGGDRQHIQNIMTGDDSKVSFTSETNVSTRLPELFATGWKDPVSGTTAAASEVRRVWTGILGMTPDNFPLVGEVPQRITGRRIDRGEWIAAGYNGVGMTQCWSCGEAIATMALGAPKPQWLPGMVLATEERLLDEQYMGSEAALGSFYGKL